MDERARSALGSARTTRAERVGVLTWMTFPSFPLYFPRVTLTSSFFRMGRARALYFSLSSLDKVVLMIFLLMEEGASK